MKRFNQWWKMWGQPIGFLFMIVYLNAFWFIFLDNFQVDERYPLAWLIQFFGLAGWYAWQSRIHGWRLPKNIKDTH